MPELTIGEKVVLDIKSIAECRQVAEGDRAFLDSLDTPTCPAQYVGKEFRNYWSLYSVPFLLMRVATSAYPNGRSVGLPAMHQHLWHFNQPQEQPEAHN